MSTFFFKTNINGIGRVDKIKPYLDKPEHDKAIEQWHLDMNSPEYLLQIETNQLRPYFPNKVS